jgi:hypothetical protein
MRSQVRLLWCVRTRLDRHAWFDRSQPKKRFGGSAEPETGRGTRGPGIIYRMLFPLPLPVPVSAVRDRWDWLTIWCTVGAAVLALVAIAFAVVAIRRGDRYAREAQEATVRERRNVFELGVLARLIEICTSFASRGSVRTVRTSA